jgi:hypothetical protein
MLQQVTGDYPAAATSLQQSLKLCHALGYWLGQAAAHLRPVLTIYQRIGARRARQVQETLRPPQAPSP